MTMISIVPSTFGQSCEIKRDGVGNDLNGTTIIVPLDDQMTFPYSIHLEVTNTSGADETWSIKRVKMNGPDDWADFICWPPMCYTGTGVSYDTPSGDGAPTILDGTDTTFNGELADLNPKVIPDNAVNSTVTYMYYIQRIDGTLVDSVGIEFTYTLGLNDQNLIENVNVYPTLVNSVVNIEMNDNNSEYSVLLTDVCGKQIFFESNVSSKCTIDVSDKRNGIYFVIIQDKFGRKATKKIVISH